MISRAWAPGHATFIFAVPQISAEIKDPLLQSSLGVGINFTAGVSTFVERSKELTVNWNNEEISGEVSKTVLDEFTKVTGMGSQVRINHVSELKIGHGLSTSGAGAIGTALALDDYFKTNLTTLQLFQLAHIADVVNHSGLGSVMGQITSGIEIRAEIGGPGVGKALSIASNESLIILMMGKLKTADVLLSEQYMAQINSSGMQSLSMLKVNENKLSLDHLFSVSREFTENCGLMTARIKEMSNRLIEMNETIHTMAMIGETLVVKPKNPSKVLEMARLHGVTAIATRITNQPPLIF